MTRDMIRDTAIKRKGFAPPYKLASLYDAGGDLSKRWEIHYWIFDEGKGKIVRFKKTIPVKDYSAKERRAYASPIIKEINRQLAEGYFIPEHARKVKRLNVVDAIDLYLEFKLPRIRSKNDYRSSMGAVKKYAETEWKKLLVVDVNKQHVIEFLDYYQKENGIGNQTRNQYKSFIHTFFEWLLERGYIENNPAIKIKQEKVQKTKKYLPFSDVQAEFLLKEIKAQYPDLWLFVQFMHFTFLRPNELRFMQVSWIEIEHNRILIPAEISKNKKAQYISIPKKLVVQIMEAKLLSKFASYYVFGKSGEPGETPYSYHVMRRRHREILQELHFPQSYSLYSWKHTGVCNLYRATKDIKLVQRQCRHSDVQTTDRYLRDLGLYLKSDELDF